MSNRTLDQILARLPITGATSTASANPASDSGKLVILGVDGKINPMLLPGGPSGVAAANVAVTPITGLSGSNVQAALQSLENTKLDIDRQFMDIPAASRGAFFYTIAQGATSDTPGCVKYANLSAAQTGTGSGVLSAEVARQVYLNKAGDSITGVVNTPVPVGAMQIANKQYVDNAISAAFETKAVPCGQTIWVDSLGGDDTTGMPSRMDKPYKTLTKALSMAPMNSGTTIHVTPGAYVGSKLLKDGVNWFFYYGAIVDQDGSAYAIFDDLGTAVTSQISGYGKFNASKGGVVKLNNSQSKLDLEATTVTVNSIEAYNIQNCLEATIVLDRTIATAGLVMYMGLGDVELYSHIIESHLTTGGLSQAVVQYGGNLSVYSGHIDCTIDAFKVYGGNLEVYSRKCSTNGSALFLVSGSAKLFVDSIVNGATSPAYSIYISGGSAEVIRSRISHTSPANTYAAVIGSALLNSCELLVSSGATYSLVGIPNIVANVSARGLMYANKDYDKTTVNIIGGLFEVSAS